MGYNHTTTGTSFKLEAHVKPAGWYRLLGPIFGMIGQKQNLSDVQKLKTISLGQHLSVNPKPPRSRLLEPAAMPTSPTLTQSAARRTSTAACLLRMSGGAEGTVISRELLEAEGSAGGVACRDGYLPRRPGGCICGDR